MFRQMLFEEVSSFYEEGRKNLEKRLSRVLTLEHAERILFDVDNFGCYRYHRFGATEEEKAEGRRKEFERMYLALTFKGAHDFLERIDPVRSRHFVPDFSKDPQFTQKYDPIPETPTEEFSEDFDEAFEEYLEEYNRQRAYYRRSLESVTWETLRELGEGVIEHGFAKSYEDERIIDLRNGQELNLGYHFYRARRTVEPTGTIAQLGLPELREFGEARESFLERNSRYILAGVPITFGLFGGVVTAVAPLYSPENIDPMLYVATGLIGLGSVGAIVQGVRTLTSQSYNSTE